MSAWCIDKRNWMCFEHRQTLYFQVEEELLEQEMIEQCFEDLYEMEQIASEILSSSPVENAFITFDSSHAGMRTNGMAHARHEHTMVIVSHEDVSILVLFTITYC